MKNRFRIACLTLAATLALSACGWQLRGEGVIPAGLTALYISSRDPDSPLVMELTRTLKSANVTVAKSAADAPYALVLLSERRTTRTATVNANARVSEQELRTEVEFLILNREGETLLPRSMLVVERVFEYNENNVLATRDEERLIRSEMRRDLVSQILNRLRQFEDEPGAPAP